MNLYIVFKYLNEINFHKDFTMNKKIFYILHIILIFSLYN